MKNKYFLQISEAKFRDIVWYLVMEINAKKTSL